MLDDIDEFVEEPDVYEIIERAHNFYQTCFYAAGFSVVFWFCLYQLIRWLCK